MELGVLRAADAVDSVNGVNGGNTTVLRSHYMIGEMAREFGFTLRALRFYEEKGLISPRRAGNRRLYSANERRRLTVIAAGKKIGLSLDDIREILRADKGDSDNQPVMKKTLEKAEDRLEALEEEKAQLDAYTTETVKLIDELKTKLAV